MRRVKRLKEAIARLERTSVATEAQLEEEFEHGYAAGYNAGRAEYMQPRPITSAEIDMVNEHAAEVQRQRDAGEPA